MHYISNLLHIYKCIFLQKNDITIRFGFTPSSLFPTSHLNLNFLIKIWSFPSDLRGCWGQRRPEKIKVSKFQIWHYFYYKKYFFFIYNNVIEILVRCTVYDLWFNSLCCFCVDWTLCHVVSASNPKMKEQSVSSRFVWRYSFSQLSIRNLGYLGLRGLSRLVIKILKKPLWKPNNSFWIKKEVLRGPFGNFEVLNGPVL